MERSLFRAAAGWTVFGLIGGVFYREFTKFFEWDTTQYTQLATVHTHALTLGGLFFLLLLVLERTFKIDATTGKMGRVFWIWNIGLAITAGMQLFKGSLTVLNHPIADHAALAGIAGLGHITLAIGFAILFHALSKALKTAPAA